MSETTNRKLVIDRTKWLRGEGGAASSLVRRSDNKMCCLGFYGLSCGLNKDQMTGKGTFAYDCVEEVSKPELRPLFESLVDFPDAKSVNPRDTTLADALMRMNDTEEFDTADCTTAAECEKIREDSLTKNFAKMGVDVTFIN